MLLQFLTSRPQRPNPLLKDPRNQQSVSILFMAVCPLAFAFFGGDPLSILISAGLLAGFGVALWWISIGIKHRKSYDEADIAKRSPVPFLIVGAVLIGISLGGLVLYRSGDILNAFVQGGLGTALSLLTFGLDPLKDKGLDTARDIRLHAAKELKTRAKDSLVAIRMSAGSLSDPDVTKRTEELCQTVVLMIKALESDPDRHRELRPHLGHYLDEIRMLIDQFVTHFRTTGDAAAREQFLTALREIEQDFTEESRHFVTSGRNALEVQLSVLKTKRGQRA